MLNYNPIINNVNLNLDSEGYKLIRENIFNINDETINEFHQIKNNKNLPHHGDVKSVKVIKDPSKFKYLNNIYQQIILILKKNNMKYKFEDVWAQNSNRNTTIKGQLPYIPHYDKIRKFKVMVYLNDINKDAGAIHYIKDMPDKYENFRKNLSEESFLKKENEVKKYYISEYEDCYGPIGTTIFFDTNTPHFAGVINDNSSKRYLYRFNFISPLKNNIFKKIIKKIQLTIHNKKTKTHKFTYR